jgi:hypothetical protein
MAFIFRLESADGAPAEPLALHTAVPNWTAGDAPAGPHVSGRGRQARRHDMRISHRFSSLKKRSESQLVLRTLVADT